MIKQLEIKVLPVYLRALSCIRRKPFVLAHKWGKMYYTGDKDMQEVYYHVHGDAWQENELKRLSDWIPEGSVVVDVGANMGFMAILFSKLVGATGQVISLEPSKKIFAKLERNIQENDPGNVKCLNLGCGSHSSKERLHAISDASGHSTLSPSAALENESDTEDIQMEKLDTITSSLDRIDFLKIDTEGFESEVLRGAENVLKSKRPIVYIELSDEYRESSESSIRILKENGYVFLTEPNLSEAHNGDNFLAVPQEKFPADRDD